MTAFRWIVAAAALIGTAGAVSAAAKVNVTQSPSAALARGSSFAWAPVPTAEYGVPDPDVANQITAGRLRALTESMLASKGYRQVTNASEADLLIAYTVIMVPEQDVKMTFSGLGCIPLCPGGGDYRLDTSRYTRGTLVLDLTERQTGRLVWRATSKKRVTRKDTSEKKLTALLGEMTKSLPQQ